MARDDDKRDRKDRREGRRLGELGKASGMGRADDHANEHWKRCFDECALRVARAKPVFDAEDIKRLLAYLHPNATTHEMRAIGPRMLTLPGRGIAVKTGQVNPSTWAACHGRPMQSWRSLIYQGRLTVKIPRIKPVNPRRFAMEDVENDDAAGK